MKKPDAKAESTDLVAADIEAPVLAADIEAPVDRSEGHWERTPDGECMWVCRELQESQMVAAANAGQSVQQSRDAGKLLTPPVQGWTKLDVAKFVEEVGETEEGGKGGEAGGNAGRRHFGRRSPSRWAH